MNKQELLEKEEAATISFKIAQLVVKEMILDEVFDD